MTPCTPENVPAWSVDWKLITVMGNATPPRDPNDNGDDEDEDDDAESEDDREPPVVREPDEDE